MEPNFNPGFGRAQPFKSSEVEKCSAAFSQGIELLKALFERIRSHAEECLSKKIRLSDNEFVHAPLITRAREDVQWAFEMAESANYIQCFTLLRSAIESIFIDKALKKDSSLVAVWLNSEEEVAKRVLKIHKIEKLIDDPGFKIYGRLCGWGTHPRCSMLPWGTVFLVGDEDDRKWSSLFEEQKALLANCLCLLILGRTVKQTAMDFVAILPPEACMSVEKYTQGCVEFVDNWCLDWLAKAGCPQMQRQEAFQRTVDAFDAVSKKLISDLWEARTN